MRVTFAVAVLLLAAGLALAQGPALQPYSWSEGFETGTPQLVLWAHNGGDPTVNFNGVTEERAASGKRSLKLDVTLGDGSYYYFGLPHSVACAGELTLSARVYVAPGTTARVGFGTNMAYPPTTHTGCGAFHDWSKPTADWETVSQDLVTSGKAGAAGVVSRNTVNLTGDNVGAVLDRWSLFCYGTAGQRVIVYVDDVRLEGKVPAEAEYRQYVAQKWSQATASFRTQVKGWQDELATARQRNVALNDTPPEGQDLVTALRAADGRADALLAKLAQAGYGSDSDTAEVQAALAAVKYGAETLRAVSEAVKAKRPFLVQAAGNAVTRLRRAGQPELLGAPPGGTLAVTACRGEFESRSALVYALRDLPGLTVKVSDLRGPAGLLPASAVEVRIVKSWYQGASGSIGYTPKKALLPELLLKDDALVRVDPATESNCLRDSAPDGTTRYLLCSGPTSENLAGVRPRDAKTLQPVDVPARTSREFWINVQIPSDAAPGSYGGNVTFSAGNVSVSLPLRVTVSSVALEPSRLIYSIYYRAHLAADSQPTIGSEAKSETQMRAELANLRDHGVLYPTNYQGWDEKLLRRVLELRREVGLPTGRFYNLGLSVLPQKSPEALAGVVKQVKEWLVLLASYGYGQAYFYGIDEATGEALRSQKVAWKAAQDAGAKTFVACYQGTFEAMGALLNCAVIAGPPDLEEVRKWHSVGSEIFCYANPQVGVEDPMIYRRNFGLKLYAAGYDGAMDYAYQHAFGHVWNDFDDKTYRDHNFTYPTLDGVVDTIEWEGFREGVDDVRYATTLECAIAAAAVRNPALAEQARQWLHDPALASGDLDQARAQMLDWITKLRATAAVGSKGLLPAPSG